MSFAVAVHAWPDKLKLRGKAFGLNVCRLFVPYSFILSFRMRHSRSVNASESLRANCLGPGKVARRPRPSDTAAEKVG